jgi:Zn-dependent peptidase ImmA (M78 family)
MPKMWLRQAWTSGLQDPAALARHFNVSRQAMQVRLMQTGLIAPDARGTSTFQYGRYQRDHAALDFDPVGAAG